MAEQSENALQLARREKKQIESDIKRTLNDFTDRTGLAVLHINAGRIEITSFGDDTPKYRYEVECEIKIDR